MEKEATPPLLRLTSADVHIPCTVTGMKTIPPSLGLMDTDAMDSLLGHAQ